MHSFSPWCRLALLAIPRPFVRDSAVNIAVLCNSQDTKHCWHSSPSPLHCVRCWFLSDIKMTSYMSQLEWLYLVSVNSRAHWGAFLQKQMRYGVICVSSSCFSLVEVVVVISDCGLNVSHWSLCQCDPRYPKLSKERIWHEWNDNEMKWQHSTTRHDTTRHGMARHSTGQYSTPQHSTAQL